MDGTLIRTYKARKAGLRGMSVSLPREWVDDENVEPGDSIEQRRDGEYLILRHVKRVRVNP
jgi:hypothetical protein